MHSNDNPERERMLFYVHWQVPIEKRDSVLERFVRTHAAAPAGLRIIGRWHLADGSGGIMVVAADSMQPVTQFAYDWNDLLFIEIAPVVLDDELTKIVEKFKQK